MLERGELVRREFEVVRESGFLLNLSIFFSKKIHSCIAFTAR